MDNKITIGGKNMSENFSKEIKKELISMERLCFAMWLVMYASTTDFHRLTKRHNRRTLISNLTIVKLLWGILLLCFY